MALKVNLELDHLYHIYNRGNNRRLIFFESLNYHYFLKLYFKYIPPIAKTYAYALLPNHFHFVISIRSENEIPSKYNTPARLSQPFANFFNTYSKAMNKRYNMVSSLFEDRFERSPLKDDNHFTQIIPYVHSNPQKHKIVEDFRMYPFTSYPDFLKGDNQKLECDETINWFGGMERFIRHHNQVFKDLQSDLRSFQNFGDLDDPKSFIL
jgi:REP element-mobilizing transposase RayT